MWIVGRRGRTWGRVVGDRGRISLEEGRKSRGRGDIPSGSQTMILSLYHQYHVSNNPRAMRCAGRIDRIDHINQDRDSRKMTRHSRLFDQRLACHTDAHQTKAVGLVLGSWNNLYDVAQMQQGVVLVPSRACTLSICAFLPNH